MPNNPKINKSGIRKLQRNLQREFDKHPISIPVTAEPSDPPHTSRLRTAQAPTIINNYHEPVITNHGDHAQIAWDAQNITQTSNHTQDIAPGFENFAQALATLLASSDELPVEDTQKQKFKMVAEELLEETTQPEPRKNLLDAGVDRLKGILAPVLCGAQQGITAESQETVQHIFEGLSQLPGLLPS